MPDGRMLSKSISHSFQLAEVSLEADYLFARCIPHLDREGRMPGNPRLVKSIACPLREEIPLEAIPALLCELAKVKLIRWYSVDGQEVVEFPGFQNHQKGARFEREAASRLPAHTSAGVVDLLRTNSGPTPAKVRVSEVKLSEVNLREVEVEVEEPGSEPDCDWTPEPNSVHRLACIRFIEEHGYGAGEKLIATGDDSTAWNKPDGHRVDWEERVRFLALAHARVQDGKNKDLRSALRYVIPQQTDPFAAPKSDKPKPGTEAAAVRSEYPNAGRSGGTTGGLELVVDEVKQKRDESNAAYAAWSKAITERLSDEPEDVKKDLEREVFTAIGDTVKMLPPHVRQKTLAAKALELYGKRIGEPQPSVAA